MTLRSTLNALTKYAAMIKLEIFLLI